MSVPSMIHLYVAQVVNLLSRPDSIASSDAALRRLFWDIDETFPEETDTIPRA